MTLMLSAATTYQKDITRQASSDNVYHVCIKKHQTCKQTHLEKSWPSFSGPEHKFRIISKKLKNVLQLPFLNYARIII